MDFGKRERGEDEEAGAGVEAGGAAEAGEADVEGRVVEHPTAGQDDDGELDPSLGGGALPFDDRLG